MCSEDEDFEQEIKGITQKLEQKTFPHTLLQEANLKVSNMERRLILRNKKKQKDKSRQFVLYLGEAWPNSQVTKSYNLLCTAEQCK